MIRRSPTRLELKLEDLQEFDYVHKMDRKRIMLAASGNEEARKLLRQDRIGYMNPAVIVAGGRTYMRRTGVPEPSTSPTATAASTSSSAIPMPTTAAASTATITMPSVPDAPTSTPTQTTDAASSSNIPRIDPSGDDGDEDGVD